MTPVPLPTERWYTLAECASQLARSPSYLRELIRVHRLCRRKVRQGKHPRLVIEVPFATLERLRRLIHR
jgi:hypothetical protein